jgi:hypothetical protein
MANHVLEARGSAPRFQPFHLAAGSDPDDSTDGRARHHPGAPHKAEELPYKVELWDDKKQGVELVLAVTAHASIGYAAYYAAAREYPDRYITLRLKNRMIARSDGPGH